MPTNADKMNARLEYKVPGLATVTRFLSCVGLCGCRCVNTLTGQTFIDNKYLKLYGILLNIIVDSTITGREGGAAAATNSRPPCTRPPAPSRRVACVFDRLALLILLIKSENTIAESFLLIQSYLSTLKEFEGIFIALICLTGLRMTTVFMVIGVLDATLINDYALIITEIDETLGTSSCKSADRSLMRLVVVVWFLGVTKLSFDFNVLIQQPKTIVFFHNFNSFQIYSFSMMLFYYLSLLSLRLKALTKYVESEEVLPQDTQIEESELILNEEFIKKEFSHYSKLKKIYEKRGHVMRIKVVFALYKQMALWAAELENRINVPVVFILLSIYSNLFMPFRLTLQLFSKPSTAGLKIPLFTDVGQIVIFGLNLIVLCESCQMLKRAIYDFIRSIELRLNDSPNHWASLTYFVQHMPTFTCYRIANVDRSLVFKFLGAVIVHGALQGQLELAQKAANLNS